MLKRILVQGIFNSLVQVFVFFLFINIAFWIAKFIVDTSAMSYSGWIAGVSTLVFAIVITVHNLIVSAFNAKGFEIAMNFITAGIFITFFAEDFGTKFSITSILVIVVFAVCLLCNWYFNKLVSGVDDSSTGNT